uniref:helix-turn-helix domain-containing protein n=1 Tax=Streptomyces luridiscabiei TaxID=164114 RepID=UPI000B272456
MPRWKALPEELDPQIREFASQLRRLVDRSGLNINAVADRTGFSKTSWDRYLNGRLLPPRRAVVALADVTGTPQHHLTTMWELAERAWSRAEMRHDMTIEAIRITQAREALGASDPAAGGRSGGPGRAAGGRHSAAGSAPRGSTATGPDGYGPDGHGPDGDRPGGHGADAHDAYGTDAHRTDGRAPFVPAQRGTVPPVPQQRQGGRRADAKRSGDTGGRNSGGRGKVIKLAVGAAGALV